MSYAADAGNQNTDFSFEPTTPMVLDIAAIQSLYGANTSYNSGNNQYVFYQSGTYHQTIWDAGGIDTFVYESAAGGEIDLTAGLLGGSDMGSAVYVQDSSGNNLHDVYSIYIANGVAIENATGGSGNDWIIGNRGNNVLNGRTGSDTVSYESGAGSGVAVNLGLTSAQNTVGAGTDTLLAIENLMGSSFNDTLMGNAGNNVLNGGAGIDNVSYAGSSAGVSVNLGSTSAQNTVGAGIDTIQGFENLIGSRFNDTLTGSGGNNTLNGGLGNDRLNGGAGIDTASYAGTASRVTVNLSSTSAQNTLGAGTDTLLSIENLVGSSFNDAFTGNASSNVLNGGSGNDWLSGGSGNDGLIGELGNDGLIGGLGNDTLTGGAGVDYFLFNTPLNGTNNKDLITDFNVTDDTIQLENDVMTAIGLSTGTLAASEFYVGAAAHDANDSIIYNKSTGALYYDADGTGASAAIQIATIGTSSHASLTNADFWVV
jgi:Ca2+-binding RTX toxin-like protein